MRRSILSVLFVVLLSSTLFAQAQQQEPPKNLKVLPKDSSQQLIRRTMVGFTNALGVECQFCHVAEVPNDFSTYDFASDEKDHKKRAREMLSMVGNINEYLQVSEGDTQVNCMTCHRGYKKPVTLEQALTKALYSEGVEESIDLYHELKENYGNGIAFDFGSDQPLNNLGYRLLQSGRTDEALRFFELNVADHPEASNPYDSLAEAYMAKGMRWQAIINYSKSLELDPNNTNAAGQLDELTTKDLEPAQSQEN